MHGNTSTAKANLEKRFIYSGFSTINYRVAFVYQSDIIMIINFKNYIQIVYCLHFSGSMSYKSSFWSSTEI